MHVRAYKNCTRGEGGRQLSLKAKHSNSILVVILQALPAVCRGISLKKNFSNYLLAAVLQVLLAVCSGINMQE